MKQHPQGTNHCPFCGSDEITDYDFDTLAGKVWQRKQCDDCDKEWDDIYVLQGYEEAN